MLVDKQQVLDMIGQNGTPEQVAQASQLLPSQIDPAQLTEIFQQIGLDSSWIGNLSASAFDPATLAEQIGGDSIGQAEGLLGKLLSLFGR